MFIFSCTPTVVKNEEFRQFGQKLDPNNVIPKRLMCIQCVHVHLDEVGKTFNFLIGQSIVFSLSGSNGGPK